MSSSNDSITTLPSLKILHLCAGNISGGAAKGAMNLHLGLRQIGVDSRFLIQNGEPDDKASLSVLNSSLLRIIERKVVSGLEKRFRKTQGEAHGFIYSSGKYAQQITRHPLFKWADIINLHWVAGGMLNFRQIKELEKPVVWTMRDMWPFTGGCHYSIECDRYRLGCGNCPILTRSSPSDITRKSMDLRARIFKKKNFHFVGISDWVTECFKQSAASNNVYPNNILTIENCIEDEDFFPETVIEARKALGLPTVGKIVLSGAVNNDAIYKGGASLKRILLKLQQKENVTVVVFGSITDMVDGCVYVGRINDNSILRQYYSAADVFISASIQEAFGKTIAESMACGTPVVAFNASGPATMIANYEDGVLVPLYDTEQFVKEVTDILSLNQSDYHQMSLQGQRKAQAKFTKEKAAISYRELYRSIIKA